MVARLAAGLPECVVKRLLMAAKCPLTFPGVLTTILEPVGPLTSVPCSVVVPCMLAVGFVVNVPVWKDKTEYLVTLICAKRKLRVSQFISPITDSAFNRKNGLLLLPSEQWLFSGWS